MKLGTLKHSSSRDGRLVVVSHDHRRACFATGVAETLRDALENWARVEQPLLDLSLRLDQSQLRDAFDLDFQKMHSPLPRSFQWADGSAFIQHVKLVRMARGAPLPETLETVPLMYQGGGDSFLAPTEDIPQIDFAHGTDFEGEVAVITDDVPMGISPSAALDRIRLVVLVNDVSLRGLIPEELAQGFGFFQSKPSSAFSPLALTPDELGESWREGRLHLPLEVEYNGAFFGRANAGEMHFHFGDLIAHAARTRTLIAGTIIGSGTVSNESREVGSSCLVERRMIEKIEEGTMRTPFMKPGDTVRIQMRDTNGTNLFGTIFQKVVSVKR